MNKILLEKYHSKIRSYLVWIKWRKYRLYTQTKFARILIIIRIVIKHNSLYE